MKRWFTAHPLLWLLLVALAFLLLSPMNLLFGLLYRTPLGGFDLLRLGLSLLLAPALSVLVLLSPGLLVARAGRIALPTLRS